MAAEPFRVADVPEMEDASPVRHTTKTVGCGLTGSVGLTGSAGLEQAVIDKITAIKQSSSASLFIILCSL